MDLAKKKVTFILQTFKESKKIITTLDEIIELSNLYDLEIIVIIDKLNDVIEELIRNYSCNDSRVRFIKRFDTCGLSSALKECCLCADSDFILIMDRYSQYQVNSAARALKTLISRNLDLVIVSGFQSKSSNNGLNRKRIIGSKIANHFAKYSLSNQYKKITDFMTGFIALRKDSCMIFIKQIDINGFKFLYELLAVSKGKLNFHEIPLTFQRRDFMESKFNYLILLDFLIFLIYSSLGRIIPRKAVSFAVAGFIGVLVQLNITYLLLWLTNLQFEVILPIAVLFSSFANFIMNNFLTFRSNRLINNSFFVGYLKFLLVASLPIIANVSLTNLFYSFFSANTFVSQIAAICIIFIWNYVVSSRLIWKN